VLNHQGRPNKKLLLRLFQSFEWKFTWSDPTLTEKVGRIIQSSGFASDCVVSSLNLQALTEIKQSFPELITGHIVFTAVGNLSRMEADFLSISAARATPRLVRVLHRRGRQVHVWTVNDIGNALSMIEMGVDNIITELSIHLKDKKTRSRIETGRSFFRITRHSGNIHSHKPGDHHHEIKLADNGFKD